MVHDQTKGIGSSFLFWTLFGSFQVSKKLGQNWPKYIMVGSRRRKLLHHHFLVTFWSQNQL